MDDGWHYGPDGEPVRGFLEGTAFQPGRVQDHMDAWGDPHPYNLRGVQAHGSAQRVTDRGRNRR